MSVRDIRTRDQQRVQDLEERGYNVEVIWEIDWQAHLTQRPEIKHYWLNIAPSLTLKSI